MCIAVDLLIAFFFSFVRDLSNPVHSQSKNYYVLSMYSRRHGNRIATKFAKSHSSALKNPTGVIGLEAYI
jgi:hypothetical protein